MHFRYSDEQLALKDTLERLISREYDFERRRALRARPWDSAEAWGQYAELGVLALPFPEESVDWAAAAWMSWSSWTDGRGLLLEPSSSTVVMCGGLLRDAASEAFDSRYPRIAAGSCKSRLAALRGGRGAMTLPTSPAAPCEAAPGGGCRAARPPCSMRPRRIIFGSARSSGATTRRTAYLLFLVPRAARV